MHPDTPSDPPLQQAELPSGPFTWTEEGEGPVVVAFHGYPGSVRDWRWLAPVLSPHVRLVRVDMPGMGGTPLATNPGPTMDDRGAFALAVLDTLELDAPVLLGHSLASSTLLSAAARSPSRARGLALLAPAGMEIHWSRREHRGLKLMGAAMDSPFEGLLKGPLDRIYRSMGFSRHLSHEQRVHAVRSALAMDFALLGEHARLLAELGGPSCFLAWTRDDQLVPRRIPEALGEVLPEGPRLSFEDGGHSLQKFQATEIGEALLRWMATLD